LKEKGLSADETDELNYITKYLNDSVKWVAGSKGKPRFSPRLFKVSSENNSYACVKMSITRIRDSYPIDSLESRILHKYLHYRNGKFIWRRDERANRAGGE